MKSLVLLAVFACGCSAEAISNAWFPLNWGTGGAACADAANNIVSNGLTISLLYKPATVQCGDSLTGLGSASYTVGWLQWNSQTSIGGHFTFQATFPTTVSAGGLAAIWLLGKTNSSATDCQTYLKTTHATSLNCLPGPAGYTEIDMAENLGFTDRQNMQIHVSTGNHNDQFTAFPSGGVATPHIYDIDWNPGVAVSFSLDHVLIGTVTGAYVPSGEMFVILQTYVTGTPTSSSYPGALGLAYFRECLVGTPSDGTCTAALAQATKAACSGANPCSGFDDEFNGTGPQSTIYVGQNFKGNATGTDCLNSYGILNNQQPSWVNAPGYVTSGVIGPGTNIHLCPNALITTQPIAWGSGTLGSPVTFTLEPSAFFQSGQINTNGQTNLIGNPSWIVTPSFSTRGHVTARP